MESASPDINPVFPDFFSHARDGVFQVFPTTAMPRHQHHHDNRRYLVRFDDANIVGDEGIEIAGFMRDRRFRQILWQARTRNLQM